jgi:hypothetical protein
MAVSICVLRSRSGQRLISARRRSVSRETPAHRGPLLTPRHLRNMPLIRDIGLFLSDVRLKIRQAAPYGNAAGRRYVVDRGERMRSDDGATSVLRRQREPPRRREPRIGSNSTLRCRAVRWLRLRQAGPRRTSSSSADRPRISADINKLCRRFWPGMTRPAGPAGSARRNDYDPPDWRTRPETYKSRRKSLQCWVAKNNAAAIAGLHHGG